ncbi:DinB family protein [Gorillibacterium sp. sgz5001074]|uniref:DinB family protein n=1 Tax=Gorillibacterium sp. sgz5001074 TaxID=3446695 RepID=UPI003F67B93E
MTSLRPVPGDYGDFFEKYVRLVPEGDLIDILEQQQMTVTAKLAEWSETASLYRYAPGKWSVKELAGHLADTERVMAYRLLRAARGDRTPLPGFDENLFMENGSFDQLPWSFLQEGLGLVRRSTIQLLGTLDEPAWSRRGVVNGHEVTPLALACIIIGHERHHLHVLEERYSEGKG